MSNQALHIPFAEKLKSVLEIFGIRLNEGPKYEVLEKHGNFEVRSFGPQLRGSVTFKGVSFDEFRERAFESLADYIFGGNSASRDIAMTAPVLQGDPACLLSNGREGRKVESAQPFFQEDDSIRGWTVSFILPTSRLVPLPPFLCKAA